VNRDRFPGLLSDEYRNWVRLDGPAGTQMVDTAIEAMNQFMRAGHNANHGGEFHAAKKTDQIVNNAREAVGRLFGADPRGVVFGPSMTALTFRFAAAVGRALTPGDEVVCTRLDHDANVRPWAIAAKRAGARVRWANPDKESLELEVAQVQEALSERTRWVAVTAASNACGSVPDLRGIVEEAHKVGARVYLDAVHAAPHRPLNVRTLGCDVLACSAYKWFGPHIGILCASPELLTELHPDKLRPSPDTAPDLWELGTLPFESLAGVTAAAQYLHQLGWDRVLDHEASLLRYASDGLSKLPHVTLYCKAPVRAPTIMFAVDGLTSRQVATALAERRIAVWHGNFYAWELERFLGLAPDGAVRAGFVHYNEMEDADRLIEAVAALR
jgi:cysteine desulfurase family protein (TIGR01976 family)